MARINKVINDKEKLVDETVSGYVKAYSDKIVKLNTGNVVARKEMTKDTVGVIIGNGSGHEPACLGFVGENMIDANAFGGLFAAPGPYDTLAAIEAADTGKGVCVLISNHAGDVLNSKMAIDMAEDDDILVKSVLLYDDVASAPKEDSLDERRGSIGTIFSYKMAGSFAKEGHSLGEVVEFTKKIVENTRSIAVGITPGTSPITGEKMFELPEGQVEIGLGVHGEAAANRMENASSKEIAKNMVKILVDDMPYVENDEIAVIVNGMGQTTMMELMIFFNDVEEILKENGIKVFKPLVGSFITTQEMGGIGLAFCKMDDELKKQWGKETNATQFPNL